MTASKSEMMKRKRAERAEQGLVRMTVYVRPEYRQKLRNYVENRLFGEAPKR